MRQDIFSISLKDQLITLPSYRANVDSLLKELGHTKDD